MLLTREKILEELVSKYGIKLTVRSFDYYRQEGLIPPIQGRKNRKGLYPDWTTELLKKIKDFQREGSKLSEIQDFCEVFFGKQKIEKEIVELRIKEKYLVAWYNSEIREERIISFLKIENNDFKCDSFITSELYGKAIVFFTAFFSDHIEFYKLIVGLYQLEDIQLVEKKRLTHGEYMAIVRAIVKPITENSRIMGQEDIFVAVFA
jgi:DNA-binding transcriptional MerR regulator